jgi:hypothetical protein
MNRLLLILLLAGVTAHGQIDNPPTSVNIVDATATGRALITATNSAAAQVVLFGTNASINDSSGLAGISLSDGQTKLLSAISFPFLGGATAAATSRTNLGLGTTNNVEFRRLKMIAANATDNADDSTLWLDTSGTNSFGSLRLSGTGGSAEKYNAYLQGGSSGLTVSSAFGFRVLSGSTAGTGSVLFSVNSSGNATLNGVNNTAPSQTNAASASSLMTRDLSDARYFGLKSHLINFGSMATKTAGGGTSASFRGAWQIFTATNTSSFASAYGSWGYLLGIPSAQHYVNFANPFSISFSRSGDLPRTGLVQYVQLGRDMTSINATNIKLAQKGVGIQFGSNGVTPFVHNGTSLTDGSLITNVSTYNRFVLRWVPTTALEVYGVANGSEPVLLGSVTSNLPTGIGVSDSVLEFSQLDSGSGGANTWLWLNTAYITTP